MHMQLCKLQFSHIKSFNETEILSFVLYVFFVSRDILDFIVQFVRDVW